MFLKRNISTKMKTKKVLRKNFFVVEEKFFFLMQVKTKILNGKFQLPGESLKSLENG